MSDPTSRGRVAIVGNGPVGQTTALLLARWGIASVLLDARPHRDGEGSKAICQQRDVLDIWDAVGGAAIAAEGLTWTTARTFHQDQELHAWSFVDAGRSPLPAFVNIGQDRTEAVLDDLIVGQPLIEVRWGCEVTGLEQDDCGVRLTCRTPAGPAEVAADYVVVAAGARASGLRAALGVEFAGESFEDRFLICDIRAELPGWESERRFYFDPPWNPGRQVLIHPTPGGVFRIDWQVPPDFDLDAEQSSGGLDRRIRQILGEVAYEIVWSSVYRFHSRVVDRMRVGRVLLAGDAAHLVAPFGARGLNSGVADAENAAWKLAAVLRGWGPPDLLDSYHDERHAAAAENLAITSATMRFLVPPDAEGWRHRRSLLAAARTDPQAREGIDSGRFAEPYWYNESALTTPDPTRPFAGRPPKGHGPRPGPGVLVPDAPLADAARSGVTRLRQLVRDGLLVLVTAQVDAQAIATAASGAVTAPVRVVPLSDLTGGGAVCDLLGARPGEAWVIRPDGYVAAVIPAAGRAISEVVHAMRRSLGFGPGATARLVTHLVDDAGLYPPESLDMSSALTRFLAQDRNPVLTGRFLCPAERLAECVAAIPRGAVVPLGLICSLEPEGLAAALASVARHRELVLASVEGPLPADRAALERREPGVACFVEIGLDAQLGRTLAWLAARGLGAKVRCGGVCRELFPSAAQLAGFVSECVARGVPFKATAGLHHARAHHDPRTGFDHHGFLNLLLATARAVDGAPGPQIQSVLEQTEADLLIAEARTMTDAQISATRRILRCYGSCSTTEPHDDLIALGLLEGNR